MNKDNAEKVDKDLIKAEAAFTQCLYHLMYRKGKLKKAKFSEADCEHEAKKLVKHSLFVIEFCDDCNRPMRVAEIKSTFKRVPSKDYRVGEE